MYSERKKKKRSVILNDFIIYRGRDMFISILNIK